MAESYIYRTENGFFTPDEMKTYVWYNYINDTRGILINTNALLLFVNFSKLQDDRSELKSLLENKDSDFRKLFNFSQ